VDSPLPSDCARRFQAERKLGSGSFGTVWLARQLSLNRLAAVKILHSDLIQDHPEHVARFLDEAKITAQLTHPNIVVLYDHGCENGIPWIAYEYLPGKSLQDRLEVGPIMVRSCLLAISQVAGALGEAHAKGVLHRDIKPANIVEVEPGVHKITDFGLARWMEGGPVRTRTGAVVGTPVYLAPEVITTGQASAQSDIYSLGITFCEVLTGKLPFPISAGHTNILFHHLTTPPTLPSKVRKGIPEGLDSIVARALAKRPSDRYASAFMLKRDIEEIIESLAERSSRSFPRMSRPVSGVTTSRVSAPGEPTVASGIERVSLASVSQPDFQHRGWLVLSSVVTAFLVVALCGTIAKRWWRDASTVVSPEARPMLGIRSLRVLPLGPRSARLEYELSGSPRGEIGFRLKAGGRVLTSGSLSSAYGSLVTTGFEPGVQYTFSTQTTDTRESPEIRFSMPTPLPIWMTVSASSDHAGISGFALEPMMLEATIHQASDGRIVFQDRMAKSHSFLFLARGLKPGSRYGLKLKSLDPSRYLSREVSESSFVTKAADLQQSLMRELPGLRSSDFADQIRPAAFLDLIPAWDAVPVIIQTLLNPRTYQNPRIVGPLARMLSLSRNPRAQEVLKYVLSKGKSPGDHLFVVRELGRLADPDAFETIFNEGAKDLLPQTEESAAVFAGALLVSDPKRAIAHFREQAKNPSSGTLFARRTFIEAVGKARLEDLAPEAIAAALSNLPELSERAAEVVAALGPRPGRVALGILLQRIGSRDDLSAASEEALRFFARIASPEDLPLVRPFLIPRKDLSVRVAATYVLGTLGGSEATQLLLAQLSDPSPTIRYAAAWGLGRLRAREAVGPLLSRLSDHEASRGRIPRALGQINDPRALSPLLTLASDAAPVARIDRAEALWALARIGPREAGAVIMSALEADCPYVRLRAAEALGMIGNSISVSALVAARKRPGEILAVRETIDWALSTIRSRRKPKGNVFLIDPCAPAERTGFELLMGERFRVETVGGWGADSRVVLAPKAGGSSSVRSTRMDLVGLVGLSGRCSLQQVVCSDCTQVEHGRLLLGLGSSARKPDAFGFATVWLERE